MNKDSKNSIPCLLYFSVLSASLSVYISGIHYGWSSPSIPILQKNPQIHITNDDAAWIASSIFIGAFVSCPICIVLLKYFGRRTIILYNNLLFAASSVLLLTAESTLMFCIARVIAGFGMGMIFTTLPLYLCEISDSRIRGSLASSFPLINNLGILTVYSVGPFLSIKQSSSVYLAIPIFLFILFYWAPESPYYLIQKNDIKSARESIKKLRSKNQVETELSMIKTIHDLDGQTCFDLISANKNIFLIIIGVRTFQVLSGMTCFTLYAEKIFGEGDNKMAAIIFGSLQVFSSLVATCLLDKTGRKPLLIVSCIGCAVCLGVQGLCLYQKEHHILIDIPKWVAVTTILLYVVMSSIGLGTVPYVLLGEIFPEKIKTLAVGVNYMYFDLLSVCITKLHQFVSDHVGDYIPFWFYMVSCVIGAVFIGGLLPETKGRSLGEIQKILERNEKDRV